MQPQPGWYPDQNGVTRYWDGNAWTGHVLPEETTTTASYVEESAAGNGADSYTAAVETTSYQQPVQQTPTPQPVVAQGTPGYHSGAPESATYTAGGSSTYISVQSGPTKPTNGLGLAGFVLALVGLFLSWVPFLGWVLWILGLILSFIGVFSQPRGFAIAGLVISAIDLIILMVVMGSIFAFLASLGS